MIQYHTLTIDPMRSFKCNSPYTVLPGLLDSRAAPPNSNPNALRAMQGGSLYHFYDGLWYDPAGTRTHDLCERRTCYPLSQPDTGGLVGHINHMDDMHYLYSKMHYLYSKITISITISNYSFIV